MESHRNLTTNAVGLCLLLSELIQYILLRLPLPDVFQFKSVSKSIALLISDQDFVRDYNLHSSSATWLFIYKKSWKRDAVLHGFTDCSNRWFKVLIADTLKEMIPRCEDLYFLTASGDHFLFALNTSQEVILVNPVLKAVKRIPPSPLGPRGTSSWRRSGMKLLSGPPGVGHFRFLFAEMNENFLVLFEYNSITDKWHSTVARENFGVLRRCNRKEGDPSFLSQVVCYWEFISNVPSEIIDQIKKPYAVMMGCLEERKGRDSVVLMSNFEGVWDIIWLSYGIGGRQWTWVPLPDCKMKGSNLARITFSSGLTLS